MAKRRGWNEGSIFERKDGKWIAAISLSRGGVGRKRRTAVCRTRKDALRRLREMQKAHEDGLPIAGDRLTVGAYLERWLRDSAKESLRPRTFIGYEMIVRTHLTPALGAIPLRKLAPGDVQAYLRRKSEDGLSARTCQYHRAILRSALSEAERWELVGRNVCKLIRPATVTRPEIRPLSPDQARQFLEGIKGDRLEALYCVALAAGLRQGEALGLNWDDVDFEGATFTVNATLQKYDGGFHLDPPKTERSRRTISLPPVLIEGLRRHGLRQKEEKLHAGPHWREDGWNLIFRTETGEPLNGSNVTHTFQSSLKRLGLPKQRFHDLRHAAATFLLIQGVPMRAVMSILGHSTMSVTSDTYSHVLPELHKDAAERMGELLWATS